MKKTLLITGGAGFIGSHFIDYIIQKEPLTHILNIDALTYSTNKYTCQALEKYPNYTFIQANIKSQKNIRTLFNQYNIQTIIHFAAETHVDYSILNPTIFIKSNVLGTLNLIQCAKEKWMKNTSLKANYKDARFIHISTDEVFGSLNLTSSKKFNETSPYQPNSPYAASKASADHIIKSFYKTYTFPSIIINCSNNYGSRQHKEKFIPTIIKSAILEQPIPIYGTGKNIRDWIYVKDHCNAIYHVYCNGELGNSYVIGGNCELSNKELAYKVCLLLDKIHPSSTQTSYTKLITFTHDRLGHDIKYSVDTAKVYKACKWTPKETIDTGLKKTVEWYIKNFHYLE